MELTEHCYSVLVVSSSVKFNTSLFGILPESRYCPITVTPDVSSARQCLAENVFDIVIINAPLPDEFGTELALDVCEGSGTGVLLLVKAEHYADMGCLSFQSRQTRRRYLNRLRFCAGRGKGFAAWSKKRPR